MLSLALAWVGVLAAGPGDDFARRYAPTMDRVEPPAALAWSMTEADTWRVARVSVECGEGFTLSMGPATAAVGHHDGNALFVVLMPDGEATVRWRGGEEAVGEAWVRLNPHELGLLLAPEQISGRGESGALTWARRTAAWKMNASWQAGGLPVIVKRGWMTIDADTCAGVRRFFVLDVAAGKADYERAFEANPVPGRGEATPGQAAAAFDATWEAFDRLYAMFGLREGVDWDSVRLDWRGRVASRTTAYEVAADLGRMLAGLEDMHAWVRFGPEEHVPVYSPARPLNADWNGTRAMIGGVAGPREGIARGRTPDGIGYIGVMSLSPRGLVAEFDGALAALRDAPAITVDLRFNGGGDEQAGRAIAGRFLDRRVVYARSRFRSGPGRDELGPALDRACDPRGPWRYEGRLVVLVGRRTMSSAESLSQMLAAVPGAVLVGDRTAGSSGRPVAVDVGLGITVGVPTWLDLDAEGNAIEGRGVQPHVWLEVPPDHFSGTHDPVLEAGLGAARRAQETGPAPAGEPGRDRRR